MGEKRHWLIRFSAEIVVLTLLGAGAVIVQLDPGTRWFGSTLDSSDPAAVLPPQGLKLPPVAAAGAVAGPLRTVRPSPARVAAAVGPMLRRQTLGRHYAVLVTDLASGRAVYRAGATTVTPASTAKLLTMTAALETLGPLARFKTSVRWVPRRRELVLVGGGDPFLAATPKQGRSSYPVRADVVTLAQGARRRLRALKVRRVRVGFDDSYFSGPAVNPAWPGTYVPEGVVPPIGPLWVDEGHSGEGFLADPAAGAGEAFRTALRDAGLKVSPTARRVRTPSSAVEVASVSSAPLGEMVERTLAVSDNEAAEVIARHVGLAVRQDGSFQAGAGAVLAVLHRLGVRVAGDRLYDGSGLSRQDRLRPDSLAGVLRLAASPRRPELRSVLTGLPVAGFTGSLQHRFARGPAAARGRVRAKTGTLTGVHGLAGVATDVSGARMGFVIVADRVPVLKTLDAQLLIDRIAGALGACTCGVGSSS